MYFLHALHFPLSPESPQRKQGHAGGKQLKAEKGLRRL